MMCGLGIELIAAEQSQTPSSATRPRPSWCAKSSVQWRSSRKPPLSPCSKGADGSASRPRGKCEGIVRAEKRPRSHGAGVYRLKKEGMRDATASLARSSD